MDRLTEAVELLKKLISTPSFSKEEHTTADILQQWLMDRGVRVQRFGNNIVAEHHTSREDAPTLLLNSHHDTVRPGEGWMHAPFQPVVEDGKLFGLGSNDAGGALVTMLMTFMHLRQYKDLTHNIVFAATAEEEISGANGMALLTAEYFTGESPCLPKLALALVGEPTQMKMAVAEKGLMVLDCTWKGRTGHAARNEGVNAIYAALADIEWFRTAQFERTSDVLGPVKMTVTQINAGSQHNVVPDVCTTVVDVRTTDAYRNEELLDIIRQHVTCDVQPRSLRLQPSSIPMDHPLLDVVKGLGIDTYASPTMSDQSLLPAGVPSVKIGPGDSARSHTPNEYITIDELDHGIATMITLMERYLR